MGGVNMKALGESIGMALSNSRQAKEDQRRQEREDFTFNRLKKQAEREDNVSALKSSVIPNYSEDAAKGTFTAGIDPTVPTNIAAAATLGAGFGIPKADAFAPTNRKDSLPAILQAALNPHMQFPRNDGTKAPLGPNPFQVSGKTPEEINRLREIEEFNRRLKAQSDAKIEENKALMDLGLKYNKLTDIPAATKFNAGVRRELATQAEEGRQNRFDETQDSKPAPKPQKDPGAAQAEKAYQASVKEWRRQMDEFEREQDELAKEARTSGQDVNSYIQKYQRKRNPGPMPQPVDPKAAQEMQALDAQTGLLARQRQRASSQTPSVRRYSVDLP